MEGFACEVGKEKRWVSGQALAASLEWKTSLEKRFDSQAQGRLLCMIVAVVISFIKGE